MLCVSTGHCREDGRRLSGACQQKAKVLITYRSNLADDSLKRQRAAQCTTQKEREETVHCSKVPHTLISASLNVYYQFLASVSCLAALRPTSLSLPSYLTCLFSVLLSLHIVCFHSVFHISFASSQPSLFPLCSAFPASDVCSTTACISGPSLCSFCVLYLAVLFLLLLYITSTFFYHMSLDSSLSLLALPFMLLPSLQK